MLNNILYQNIKNFVDIKDNSYIYGWGRKKSGIRAIEQAKKENKKFLLFEDGFIRSIGLGVDGCKSFSVVKDDIGIYYDATAPSRLEKILKEYDFKSDKELINEAKKAIELIKWHKISKYNQSILYLPSYLKTSEKRVLIIAQTKGDLSLKYGLAEEFDSKEMVLDAIAENSDSQIYLKVHPDVLSGKKNSNIDINFAKKHCKIIKEDINPIMLLEAFDKVYTQTSQMGFEALLLGKEVKVYGMPFYAGWNLKNLKLKKEFKDVLQRRGKTLSTEELFAGSYILYSSYYNPFRDKKSNIIDTIQTIVKYRDIYIKNDKKSYFFGFKPWKQKNIKEFFVTFKKNSSNSILCIGDSHIRVFENKLFKKFFKDYHFNIIYVPGASAYGLGNKNSKTKAYTIFKNALNTYRYKKIFITLGEVDCAYTIWAKYKRDDSDIDKLLETSIQRYKSFLEEISEFAEVVVLETPLQTVKKDTNCDDSISGIRKSIDITRKEKIKLTLKFNREIKNWIKNKKNIKFLEYEKFVYNKKTKDIRKWILNSNNPCDHHYSKIKYAILTLLIIKYKKILSNKSNLFFCKSLFEAEKLGLDKNSQIYIWGRLGFDEVVDFALKNNIPLNRIEDGFLRSVTLGSNLTKSYSIVVDEYGIYFDPTNTSKLEQIYLNTKFDKDILNRADKIKNCILKSKLSKYNLYDDIRLNIPKNKKAILVIGQVEDDASIIYGGNEMSNLKLLQEVNANNKDAFILYKPHPDVISGKRKGHIDDKEILKYCDKVVTKASIDSVLNTVDEVHTITSLVGFEALMRGKTVYTYGMPFYAGWGLTIDKLKIDRRNKKLNILELIAGAYILYPCYLSPKSNRLCEVEVLIKELNEMKTKFNSNKIYKAYIYFKAILYRYLKFFINIKLFS
jgi:capsule polysaccharide export protein KpsC/LpsZ